MTVRIPMTPASLGRSRIASSAAVEVVGTLCAHSAPPGGPHVAKWRDRAKQRVPAADLHLLNGIVDGRAFYIPDFLLPAPLGPLSDMADAAAAIAHTDPAEIDYHLDIAFRGRPIRPHVAALYVGPEGLERHRRVMPDSVRAALRGGPTALAERVAEAMVRYFDAAIAPDWPRVRDVLEADMADRGVRIAEKGPIALLDDLDSELAWRDDAVEVARPFDLTVDWAVDGLLLVPSTTRLGGVSLCAEEPAPPMVIYPARATAALWSDAAVVADSEIVDLIGHTRATLLSQLADPGTTGELSRRLALTPATVSYHLGILRRAGLVRRVRRGPRVTYERSDRARHLLGSP